MASGKGATANRSWDNCSAIGTGVRTWFHEASRTPDVWGIKRNANDEVSAVSMGQDVGYQARNSAQKL